MLNIEKFDNEKGYTIKINTDDGIFFISFCGNLDLYFNYECKESILDSNNIQKVTITKENYFLYRLFECLYEDIKNNKVSYFYDPLMLDDDEYMDYQKQRNEKLKLQEESNPRRLFKNDRVEWHSDDYTYDDASVLTIEKINEEIILNFVKGKTDLLPETFAIRICNSGSRHQPFNVLFMHLYNKLIDYEPEFHQIHFEEVLYEMKRTRKKNPN